MSAREEILSKIRKGLNRGPLSPEAARGLTARMADPPASVIPAQAKGDVAMLLARFREMAKRAGATVAHCEDTHELAREIARFVTEASLPRAIRMAPDPELDFIALSKQTGFSIARGAAEAGDRVGLSLALAGIAETGTIMVSSSAAHPMTLAFLVEAHVAILPRARLTGSYEEAMEMFRAAPGAAHALPRAVTFITGPSRSADIEQKIQFGAHGPRRLHIVVLEQSP